CLIPVAHDELHERLGKLHLVMDRRAGDAVDHAAARLRDLRLALAEHSIDPPRDALHRPTRLAQLAKPRLEMCVVDRVQLARDARQAHDRHAADGDLEARREPGRVYINPSARWNANLAQLDRSHFYTSRKPRFHALPRLV